MSGGIAQRTRTFCQRFRLKTPILLAPMAGACPPALSAAVASAGGMGACGAVSMSPDDIRAWARDFRAKSDGPFQLNNWIPGPPPRRDSPHETVIRAYLSKWGPPVPAADADMKQPDFEEQCHAMLGEQPTIISSMMGLYPPAFIERMKQQGIAWFATATTVEEARAAEAAGADAIIAQGAEAGGHRGAFHVEDADRKLVGLSALVPAVVDVVRIPVVAAGGIADGRGVAAALSLGASAVMVGTGFLRSPEANIPPAWADALGHTAPEDTVVSRVFSGRPGRSIVTRYVREATFLDAPVPAPYPVQRNLTARMRAQSIRDEDVGCMQAWAGQSARLAKALPAAEVLEGMWKETRDILQVVLSRDLV